MPLLSKIEAAMKLGVSVELIEYFVTTPPKRDSTRKLVSVVKGGETLFDENELTDYHRFLRQPWPKSPKGKRPHIPAAIAKDVKEESHYGCAICGLMDNGEIAHIEPVADTEDNSPDNLLYLCPNHHTKYDYGFKPSSNVTPEVMDMRPRL